MYDMSSMLQKVIRRSDVPYASYVARELYSRFRKQVWNLLLAASDKDCHVVITEEAEGIFTELAGKGNLYAKFVMVQSRLAPVKPAKKTLTPREAEGVYQMGEKYFYGRGVAVDYKKAAEYYLQAAKAGHADAQY